MGEFANCVMVILVQLLYLTHYLGRGHAITTKCEKRAPFWEGLGKDAFRPGTAGQISIQLQGCFTNATE